MPEEFQNQQHKQSNTWLLEYVNAHICDPDICLTQAADQMGTSIYNVSRLFKSTTGQGFKAYITEKRMQLAQKKLLETNESISQIAEDVGFEQVAYFGMLFRRWYGNSPSCYRMEYQAE